MKQQPSVSIPAWPATRQPELSKARRKRVSSRPVWNLLVWDSSPVWHTRRTRRCQRSRALPAPMAPTGAGRRRASLAARWRWCAL
eukprot:scaffold114265_cov51-Phaeocystis_antarctica.AAC.2